MSESSAAAERHPQGAHRYRSDAYGRRTVLASNGTTVLPESGVDNQIGFTGRYEDSETGLVYMRSRYLSASLGRFLQRDMCPKIARYQDYSNLRSEQKREIAKRAITVDPLVRQTMPRAGAGYQDGMNLYNSYFIPNTTDPLGMDSPGCDLGAAQSIMETNCILGCCANHDKCYHDNNCSFTSWFGNLTPFWKCSPCMKCNRDVYQCVLNCANPLGSWPEAPGLYYDGVTDTFFNNPRDPRMGNSTTGTPRANLPPPYPEVPAPLSTPPITSLPYPRASNGILW